MDNEINKLELQVLSLKDEISCHGTCAGYILTMLEQLRYDYFAKPKSKLTKMDIEKIGCEYTTVQHFLEIAHDYTAEIRKGVEKHGLL